MLLVNVFMLLNYCYKKSITIIIFFFLISDICLSDVGLEGGGIESNSTKTNFDASADVTTRGT